MATSICSLTFTIVCSSGRRGIVLSKLWDAINAESFNVGVVDTAMQQWIWNHSLLSHSEISVSISEQHVINTLSTHSHKSQLTLDLDACRDLDILRQADEIVVTACEAARMRYLGLESLKSSGMLTSTIDLVEIIGRSRQYGVIKTEIASEFTGGAKELYRRLKFLIDRNFVVRSYEFGGLLRPTKLLPPMLAPRFFLTSFSPFPLSVHEPPAIKASHERQDTPSQTAYVDRHIVPYLLQWLCDEDTHELLESELQTRAEQAGLISSTSWIFACQRLLIDERVQWAQLRRDNCFREGFRFDENVPVRVNDHLQLKSRSDTLHRGDISGLVFELPLSAQMYRLIDASGANGILTIDLFEMLELPHKPAHRILLSLESLPDKNACIERVSDRHGTTVTYRLFVRRNRPHRLVDSELSSSPTAHTTSKNCDRAVNTDSGVDDDDKARRVRMPTADFVQRMSWVRDIVKTRGIVRERVLLRLLRHRGGVSSSVHTTTMDHRTLVAVLQRLVDDRVIHIRDIRPITNDGSVVRVVFDAKFDPDDPQAIQDAREAALMFDPEYEQFMQVERDSQRGGRTKVIALTLPILYGFVRARMIRCKLFHAHIVSMSRIHEQSTWYMIDILRSMPLWLFLSVAGVVEFLPVDMLRDPIRLRWPIADHQRAHRELMLDSLYKASTPQSNRLQDLLELLQRLGVLRLVIPFMEYPTQWQMVVYDRCQRWSPQHAIISTPQGFQVFWASLRSNCQAIVQLSSTNFLPKDSEFQRPLQDTNEDERSDACHIDDNNCRLGKDVRMFLRAFEPGTFPELYSDSSWLLTRLVNQMKRQRLLEFEKSRRIETDADVIAAAKTANMTNGVVAWFFAKLHCSTVQYVADVECLHDEWPRIGDKLKSSRDSINNNDQLLLAAKAAKEATAAAVAAASGASQQRRSFSFEPQSHDVKPQLKMKRVRFGFRESICSRGRNDDEKDGGEDDENENEAQDQDQKMNEEIDNDEMPDPQYRMTQEYLDDDDDGDDDDDDDDDDQISDNVEQEPECKREGLARQLVEPRRPVRGQKALSRQITPVKSVSNVTSSSVKVEKRQSFLVSDLNNNGKAEASRLPPNSNEKIPWSKDVLEMALRVYDVRRKPRPSMDELKNVSDSYPRLHALCIAMIMILGQPDKEYKASSGFELMRRFNDQEIESVFLLLRRAKLVVKQRRNNDLRRGYFTLAIRALDYAQHPTLPSLLPSVAERHCARLCSDNVNLCLFDDAKDNHVSEMGGLVAATVGLLVENRVVFNTDTAKSLPAILIESDSVDWLKEIIIALDSVCTTSSDERCEEFDISYRSPSHIDSADAEVILAPCNAELRERIVAFIDVKGDCVSIDKITNECCSNDRESVHLVLRHLQNDMRVFSVNVCASELFISANLVQTSVWSLSNAMVQQNCDALDTFCSNKDDEEAVLLSCWRLLDGSLNVDMVHSVRWALISAALLRPGIEQCALHRLVPTLPLIELNHVLNLLELDCLIRRRFCIEALNGIERVLYRYFPTAQCLAHLSTMTGAS